jgi:hypothetical protein
MRRRKTSPSTMFDTVFGALPDTALPMLLIVLLL